MSPCEAIAVIRRVIDTAILDVQEDREALRALAVLEDASTPRERNVLKKNIVTVREMYESGKSVHDIAVHFKMTDARVLQVMNECGIERRAPGPQVKHLFDIEGELLTAKEIAERVGMSESGVRYRLRVSMVKPYTWRKLRQ